MSTCSPFRAGRLGPRSPHVSVHKVQSRFDRDVWQPAEALEKVRNSTFEVSTLRENLRSAPVLLSVPAQPLNAVIPRGRWQQSLRGRDNTHPSRFNIRFYHRVAK